MKQSLYYVYSYQFVVIAEFTHGLVLPAFFDCKIYDLC